MPKHDGYVYCCDCGIEVKYKWYESVRLKLKIMGWLVEGDLLLCKACKQEYEYDNRHLHHSS